MDIVITGIGAITPAAKNIEDVFSDLVSGETNTKRVIEDFDFSEYINPWKARKMNRLGQLSTVAAVMAVKDSGLEINDENRNRIGSIYSTCNASFETNRSEVNNIIAKDLSGISTFKFPMTTSNSPLGAITRTLKVKGSSSAIVGSDPIHYGSLLLKSGTCDSIVIVGADEYSDLYDKTYRELGFNVSDNKCEIYSGYKGFRYSEGFSSIVLETKEHAIKRNARIYCDLKNSIGYMDTKTQPLMNKYFDIDEETLFDSMNGSLENINPNLNGFVMGTGNGTLIDKKEFSAFNKISSNFKAVKKLVNIKDYSGESFSGSSILNLSVAAMALKKQVLPSSVISEKQKSLNVSFSIVNSYLPNGSITSHMLSSNVGE